jgi:hypothetical protein
VLFILKAACLAIYALALAAVAGLLPHGISGPVQVVAAIFLGVHTLELALIFMFRKVHLYRGHVWMFAILTIMFGLLHWLPFCVAKPRNY